jgi:hypothetical protein
VLERDDVVSALGKCNADALWLRLYNKGKQVKVAGSTESFKAKGNMPVGRSNWHFVAI